ncbi:DUF3291 domain-containing protein [Pseudozobellia thermophila]|uniref:DUF3291 domain-containing protein n=1 Tax=Pseudozobellia thermophila TaxID=192903 RepID=A0A1M6GSL9_9FLAO|nr:DUF3291 domain-containing protein [Pseudozobellia thermophila]SHJ12876.1 protein of unknown function [Pseudozobellia thermophila]
MNEYHLAQVNIARMLAPIDSEVMQDFVNNLDRINGLAEKSIGFVWRLEGDEGNATALRIFEDDFLIVNMSVWRSKEALFNFTYASQHVGVLKRKKEWFHKMTDRHMCLWYVPAGTEPTPADAKLRLRYLNEHGDSPYAFGFKGRYTVEEALNYKVKS